MLYVFAFWSSSNVFVSEQVLILLMKKKMVLQKSLSRTRRDDLRRLNVDFHRTSRQKAGDFE